MSDSLRKDYRPSKLDAELDARVNKILYNIPSHLENKTYDYSLQSLLKTPAHHHQPEESFLKSPSSKEKPSNSHNTLHKSSLHHSSPLNSEKYLTRSMLTSSAHYAVQDPYPTSPSKSYRDSLSHRVEEAIQRSQHLSHLSQRSQIHSNSPNWKNPQLQKPKAETHIDLINQKVNEALLRSQLTLEISTQHSPYHSPSHSKAAEQKNYFISSSPGAIASHQRSPIKYSSPSNKIQFVESLKNYEKNIDEVFQHAMKRSQAILQKSEETDLSRFESSSAFKQQSKLTEQYSPSQSKYSDPLKGILKTVPAENKRLDQGTNEVNAVYTSSSALKRKTVEENLGNGTSYKGEKINGKRYGKGTFVDKTGIKYDGEWEDDIKCGNGVQMLANGKIEYEGEWLDDKYHGPGRLHNQQPRLLSEGFDYCDFGKLAGAWFSYEGEFQQGNWHGLGTLNLSNGERFVGKFRSNQLNGAGTFYQINGEDITGEWVDDKFIGSL